MQRSTPIRGSVATARYGYTSSPLSSVKLEAAKSTTRVEYPSRLSFYDRAPPIEAEVSLEEFETWALERKEVLDKLDTISGATLTELEKEMRPLLQKNIPLSPNGPDRRNIHLTQNERRKDQLSHFILRLAFSRTPEDRQRFVRLETLLFRLRYELASLEEREEFVSSLNLDWQKAGPGEIAELEPQLRFHKPSSTEPLGSFYKVEMEKVLDMVGRYQVFLRAGIAYVPDSLQINLLTKDFALKLERGLTAIARRRNEFTDDSRMEPVLQMSGAVTKTFKSSSINGEIAAADLDSLDKKNCLPMCSSVLHKSLKKTRHATYQERLQFRNFLKNIGMSVEETIKLYREYYSEDQMDYNVKHMYGLVGSRKDYGPQSCLQIYNSSRATPADKANGCPFQRLGPDALERLLRQHGISDDDGISEVKRFSNENQIHLACSKTYALVHPEDKTEYGSTISSPNEYFERAWNYTKSAEQKS